MFQSLMAKLAARKKKSDPSEEMVSDIPVENSGVFPEEELVADEAKVDENIPYDEMQPRKKVSVLKIVLFTVLFLLIAAIGAGYYYISNIDWNLHKDKIAAEFSNITGKKIVFEGPVHLTLFPSPSLQAENIKIYNPGKNLNEPLAEVKSLVANLTLKSLIKGDFDVKMMSLVEPNLHFEMLDDGKLNWDTPLSNAQRATLENMQITLDSVLVKNATIHWIDEAKKRNYIINNINAEVIAQSIFGPYRIEGTYIKNDNPEGFAFSIGKINSGLSTSINAVINQPSTETFVRFDGSILPQNDAVNGNLIFESKKLMDFVNSNSDKFKLKAEYDYPLALTLELKSNKQKIELTNFAMKYGDSAGAGNLLVPLTAGEYHTQEQKGSFRPKVEFGFNFATLDMEPVAKLFKELWNKYKTGEANYNPQLPFDVLADMKAVKTTYKGQSIKNFQISLDEIDNKITIRNFSAVLPGDTAVNLKGDIYSDLGYLTFKLEPTLKTEDFRQTLSWFGFVPQIAKDSLLRHVNMSTKVFGNFNEVKISPFSMGLDNSVINGEFRLNNGKAFDVYAALKTNIVNVDDYFPFLVVNNPDKEWMENLNARFQQLKFSPDMNVDLNLETSTLLYNDVPYSGVSLIGSLKQGVLQVSSFNVENMYGAKLGLKGIVKGFGKQAEIENLEFDFETKNLSEFVDKMKLSISGFDVKKFNNFSAKGFVSGSTNRFITKSNLQLGNVNINYGGLCKLKDGVYGLKGLLEVKSPDFVKMVNDFNFHYEPRTYVLGLFNMQGNFEGNLQKFNISNWLFNIGSNTFNGSVEYVHNGETPQIKTDLTINRLELDKFFYNTAKEAGAEKNEFRPQVANKVDFLERPIFDSEKFNFDFLKTLDYSGKFNVSRLSYRDFNFDSAKFSFSSKGNVMTLSDFNADFDGGKVITNFELLMQPENPVIKGNLTLDRVELDEKKFGGAKYGLKKGVFGIRSSYKTSALSFADMYEKLQCEGTFAFADVIMKGWNIADIYKDLLERKTPDGLSNFVKSKLINGNEPISSAQGSFSIDNGRFSILDSVWQGKEYTANLKANASLNNWEGEATFLIDFKQPDNLPNWGIVYSGALNVPEMNIDIEDLVVMYNQKQKEIQAKEAAEQAALKEKLRKKLSDSLLETKAMESELENVVRPDLALKKQKELGPEFVKIYANIEQRMDIIETDLAEILLTAQNPDVTDAIIEDIRLRNARNLKYINDLKNEIQKVDLDNLHSFVMQKKNSINQKNAMAEKYIEDGNREEDNLEKRLSLIKTTYLIDEDANFLRLKNTFQRKIEPLKQLNEKVEAAYQDVDKKDIAALENLLQEFSVLDKEAEAYLSEIVLAYNQLFDYASERVQIAEYAYQKQKREEEIKKKLEENTGSISVKGTGVSKTVVRDLEDIEKSEEAIGHKDIKILDFRNSGVITEKKNPVVKNVNQVEKNAPENQKLLIRKTDGKISKASGVIIKK